MAGGNQSVTLVFPGKEIYRSSKEGPYTLRNLRITVSTDDGDRMSGRPSNTAVTGGAYSSWLSFEREDFPVMTWQSPVFERLTRGTNFNFDLKWNVSDGNGSTTVDLYYNTVVNSPNGTAIITDLAANNGDMSRTWDMSALPDGVYYVYARIRNEDFSRVVYGGSVRKLTDTDGDGMPDAWETANGLNPNSDADAYLDPDGDGLSNLDEYINNTNPRAADTDGGGESDLSEVMNGRDPLAQADDVTGVTVLAASPAQGDSRGGDQVMIVGSGFRTGATVSFGNVAATGVTFINSTKLLVTTPAGNIGKVNLTVTNPANGGGVNSANAFEYLYRFTEAPLAGSNGPVCAGATVNLVASTIPGAAYVWTGPNGFTSSVQNPAIAAATGVASGVYSVTATISGYAFPAATTAVTVNASTGIALQPSSQAICVGAPASLSVTASGTGPFTYQWRKNGSNIADATGNSFNIGSVTTGDAGSYDVVITGACGNKTSSAATLTVNTATGIALQPSNQTVCAGAPVSLSVTASGIGTFTYQWRKNGSNIAGATGSTFSIASVAASNAGSYDVVITGSCGAAATSNAAALTVNAVTSIATQPVSQTLCTGSPASFTVAASGTGPITYQWRKNGSNIAGATNSTYAIAAVVTGDAASYDVVVMGTCGTATSIATPLTVNSATGFVTQPTNQAVCAGSPTSFSVTASGTGPFTYQWRKNGSNIAGATGSTFSLASVTASDAATYDVAVTGTCGNAASSAATLTVNAATGVASQPSSQTICPGAPASFSVTASGTGPFTYQWRKNGSNIAGATGSTFSIASVAASNAGSYDVVVTGSCGAATSSAAPLTVNATTAITTQPSSQTVCAGTSATFAAAAVGTNLSYQWRRDLTPIQGANAATLTLNSVTAANAGSYDVVVTGTCGTVTSATVTLTINVGPSLTAQPLNQVVVAGSNATFTAVAGGTPAPTMQWQVSTDGGATFNNINGATNTTLTVSSLTLSDNGKRYRAVFTNSCGMAASNAATLTLANLVVNVSAASYSGAQLAPEALVSAFGNELATGTVAASTLPLPTTLNGTTVKVSDSTGTERLAALFFVSPTQINYQIPPGTAAGVATAIVTSSSGALSVGTLQIAAVAPGLFSANASGQGLAAALAFRVKSNGEQPYEPIARFDSTVSRMVAVPIDLGPAGEQVFLILYGTGIRFRSSLAAVTVKLGGVDAPVSFAQAQGSLIGVNQVNALIPRSLIGRGEVDVVLTVDGKAANTVRVAIK